MIEIFPKKLNIYIATRFFVAILITFFFCAFLIYIIDLVEMLRQASKSNSHVSSLKIGLLTLLRLPAYTEFLLSFGVLVGSIGTLLNLSRKSELAVMRAAGVSAWQFLYPGLIVAFLLGIFGITVYNPLAASWRSHADLLTAKYFGREINLLNVSSSGSWLRQEGVDGHSILSAVRVAQKGVELNGVNGFVFDPSGHFIERLEAASAVLKDGYWLLEDVLVTRPGEAQQKFGSYILSTHLSPERVSDALGNVISVSFWDLPRLIEVAEKSGLSTSRLKLQYEMLLSRPFLCLSMVFLGATVSLRSFRSGGIMTMVATGMIGGLGFFLIAEISRQFGTAGWLPPFVAVWFPIALAIIGSTTVLLHQEDG
ncbi:MAG: LPS export ABC transporter permease LptG [Hyphomicrobium sp.]